MANKAMADNVTAMEDADAADGLPMNAAGKEAILLLQSSAISAGKTEARLRRNVSHNPASKLQLCSSKVMNHGLSEHSQPRARNLRARNAAMAAGIYLPIQPRMRAPKLIASHTCD